MHVAPAGSARPPGSTVLTAVESGTRSSRRGLLRLDVDDTALAESGVAQRHRDTVCQGPGCPLAVEGLKVPQLAAVPEL